MSPKKHERWCSSVEDKNLRCNCRDKHDDFRVPHELSAAEVLTDFYPAGNPRPPRVLKYLKEHPLPPDDEDE